MPNRLEQSEQEHRDACKRIAQRFTLPRIARNMTTADRTDLIDDLITISGGDEDVYGDLLDIIEKGEA